MSLTVYGEYEHKKITITVLILRFNINSFACANGLFFLELFPLYCIFFFFAYLTAPFSFKKGYDISNFAL